MTILQTNTPRKPLNPDILRQKVGGGGVRLAEYLSRNLLPPQQVNQVSQHRKVDQQQAEPEPARPLRQLIQLPRQKRDRQKQRQVLRPDLLEQQPHTLRQRQRRIGERSQTDLPQPMRIDQVYLIQQHGYEPALRIELQRRRQPHHLVPQVFVQQVDCADPK